MQLVRFSSVVAMLSIAVLQTLYHWRLTETHLTKLLLDILSPPAYHRAMRFYRLALPFTTAVRMVLLLIAIFLFILFIVAVALSAKTWRAWHIVVAVLTYLAAFGLLVVASYSVKTSGFWKNEFAKAKTSLEAAEKQGVVLEWGDPLLGGVAHTDRE